MPIVETAPTRPLTAIPHVWAGLALVAASWGASWSGATPLAQHSFFPLWFGYILVVDAVVLHRSGSSLLTRGRRHFILLFVASIPLWWLFEALNARLDNWSYQLPHRYSWFAYHAEATLAFSTVVPALFETAELYRTFGAGGDARRRFALPLSNSGWTLISMSGAVMLALVLIAPRVFFPLVWIGLFFLVDPIVRRVGGSSIASQVESGNWSTVRILCAAGLTCGFFWEMWNVRAMPKWSYDIAYAEFAHLFEMPLLGYGGYLPFALETYAIVRLLDRAFGMWPPGYLRFDRADPPGPH